MTERRNGEPWRKYMEREIEVLREVIENLEDKMELKFDARDRALGDKKAQDRVERRLLFSVLFTLIAIAAVVVKFF